MKPSTKFAPPLPGREPDITVLLSDYKNPESLRSIMEWAYPLLRNIAVRYVRNELPGLTLRATALVNESCLRLIENPTAFRKNRRYFIGAASRTMRRLLVDGARRRRAQKRGGDWQRVDFSEAERIGFEQPDELLDFEAALKRLEKIHPQLSKVVELRVFGQLSTEAAAEALGIGRSTARKRWTQAKTWLRNDLKDRA